MNDYDLKVYREVSIWQRAMLRRPGYFNRLSKRIQDRINRIIPEKVHSAITTAIKQMFRVVLFGSKVTTASARTEGSLELREAVVLEKIKFYKHTAAAEGGITGAGGILLGLADFPLLLGIKIKLLFEIASVYGFDTDDYRERLYLLYIFQLAFCSDQRRKEIYEKIRDWENISKQLPEDIHEFDWRTFQQEYRDYIDLAKMAQLVPVIGAPVGAIVNYRLITKLGRTAMNAYRLRLQKRLN
ncbi:EcsC family protein [Segetibacter aerophilus]|uniref:ABC transporter-associated protein EcsC n=1 Tax=Segetibacter aerophilus TaxID=670293 RepID=A0A512B982_9BACT|nr:EcsC family protein [Segetibacter aerophilus]GEO08521.1 ABC transporter-associated protein EcsC [Segetibacter aerophilus]